MYRLAIAALMVALAIALLAYVLREALRMVGVEAGRTTTDNGGAMPKIAFFLLLCVMAYAISTGAS
ncbi:MAG: hypothetical protein AAF762_01310 [Pseudomonadota bacterium]